MVPSGVACLRGAMGAHLAEVWLWPMACVGLWSGAGILRILYCRESTAPVLVCLHALILMSILQQLGQQGQGQN